MFQLILKIIRFFKGEENKVDKKMSSLGEKTNEYTRLSPKSWLLTNNPKTIPYNINLRIPLSITKNLIFIKDKSSMFIIFYPFIFSYNLEKFIPQLTPNYKFHHIQENLHLKYVILRFDSNQFQYNIKNSLMSEGITFCKIYSIKQIDF